MTAKWTRDDSSSTVSHLKPPNLSRASRPDEPASGAGESLEPRPPLDPYLAWAQKTKWRGYRRLLGKLGTGGESIERVRVLVKAPDDLADSALAELQGDGDPSTNTKWIVAPVYKQPLSGTGRRSRYFTAEVPMENLGWLSSRPSGIEWELALPFRDAETAARAVNIGMTGPTRSPDTFRPEGDSPFKDVKASGDAIKGAANAFVVGSDEHRAVIAIIDFGCPFLNSAFSNEAKTGTRIGALWDQGSDFTNREPWQKAERMGYGRVLQSETLDRLVERVWTRGDGAQSIDEADAYRHLDYLIDYDDARRRIWKATHGSHVTDLAAGSFDPLRRRDLDSPETGEDPASEAPIVFVQLPSLTGADCAGGSLSAQVLDALRFVLDVTHEDHRVIVNLSYGTFAGPHDGSSLIEGAIDELVGAREGRLIVVLGAGNSRQSDCHVRRIVRQSRSVLLRVGIEEGDFTDTFVETWIGPEERDENPAFRCMRMRVRTADGDWSPPIEPGQQAVLCETGEDRPIALLRFDANVPGGAGALALLCVAPTARPADDDGGLAPVGVWEVEFFFVDEAAPDATVELDSWVERDDPGWLGHGVQPSFMDQVDGDSEQTLNSLATGALTIAVGGFRASTLEITDYSSIGTRKGPPVVYAQCEESAELPNIRAAAVLSTDSLRMNGTSVAAPVFLRRAYNWLVRAERDKKDLPTDPRKFIDQMIGGTVEAERRGQGCVRSLDGK